MDTITSNIKRISSRYILIVSDSCYSGTPTRSAVTKLDSGQARDRYLEKMKVKNSLTLLAGALSTAIQPTGHPAVWHRPDRAWKNHPISPADGGKLIFRQTRETQGEAESHKRYRQNAITHYYRITDHNT